MKNDLQENLAQGKTDQVLAVLRATTGLNKNDQSLVLLLAARYADHERQWHTGTLPQEAYNLERNKINAALLTVVERLPEEDNSEEAQRHLGTAATPENLIHQNKNNMEQKHSGSGDNVAGNKIDKQINMGSNSTYIENQNTNQSPKSETSAYQKGENLAPQKLPETPSGIIGLIVGWTPKTVRPFVAILTLFIALYVGYYYFMPKYSKKVDEKSAQTNLPEKVYVSGIIHINDGEPKPNEIKRMALRDIDANPARIDGVGKFAFTDVKIPTNKRLLVDVTFADGRTVATEELKVGEVDKETNTVRLPDLYATRPQPAKGGRPATGWKIQLNINTGSGTQHNTQN